MSLSAVGANRGDVRTSLREHRCPVLVLLHSCCGISQARGHMRKRPHPTNMKPLHGCPTSQCFLTVVELYRSVILLVRQLSLARYRAHLWPRVALSALRFRCPGFSCQWQRTALCTGTLHAAEWSIACRLVWQPTRAAVSSRIPPTTEGGCSASKAAFLCRSAG